MIKYLKLAFWSAVDEVAERFMAENNSEPFHSNWAIQAGELVPIVRVDRNDRVTLDMVSWGTHSDSTNLAPRSLYMSVLEYRQNIYEPAFKHRCLIPINMLYEHIDSKEDSFTSYLGFARSYSKSVAVAGVWYELNKDRPGNSEVFFILNSQSPLNIKMFNPVVVDNMDWSTWLGSKPGDISRILSPYTSLAREKDKYLPGICQIPESVCTE